MPNPNVEEHKGHGVILVRSDPSADKNLTPKPSNDFSRDDRITAASASENITSADPHDTDAASTIARSTFSGYSEQKFLLSNGRRHTVQQGPQKSAGRKAYLRVCKGVNIFVPIDINEEVTSMHDSSIAKLARTVKKNEESSLQHGDTGTAGRRSI